MKARKGSAGKLGARRGWVVNATPRLLYSQKQYGTYWYMGLGDRKNTFAKIHNPIRPKCMRFNIQLLAIVYRSQVVVICGGVKAKSVVNYETISRYGYEPNTIKLRC